MDLHYQAALLLQSRVHEVWNSEDSMKAYYEELFPALPFDRTHNWGLVVRTMFQSAWEKVAVGSQLHSADVLVILHSLWHLLDFNLFTQVALNARFVLPYDTDMISAEVDRLKVKYANKEKTPFAPKVKLAVVETEADLEWNTDLQIVKANSTLRCSGLFSSRVSPKGTTPAISDSYNLSMLGVAVDRFLMGPATCLNWLPPSSDQVMRMQPDGGFTVEGVAYPFYSKSGGDTLAKVLHARKIMHCVWGDFAHGLWGESQSPLPFFVLRQNSLMLLGEIEEHPDMPGIVFSKNSRVNL